MNKTKITYLFIIALLTTHHTQVKSGFIGTIAGAAVAVALFYGYTKYQESLKSDSDKIIDDIAKDAKSVIKQAKEIKEKYS